MKKNFQSLHSDDEFFTCPEKSSLEDYDEYSSDYNDSEKELEQFVNDIPKQVDSVGIFFELYEVSKKLSSHGSGFHGEPTMIDIAKEMIDDMFEKHGEVILNTRGESGDTLLHHAVRYNVPDMALHFLKCGADPHITNTKGKTAYQYSKMSEEIIKILERQSELEKRKYFVYLLFQDDKS